MPMYEYAVKVRNSFGWKYDIGPLLTDDWEEAVGFLRDTIRDALWHRADYEGWEKVGAMSEEKLLLAGKTSKPKIRLVRRRVGEWKTVRTPKKKEGGQG